MIIIIFNTTLLFWVSDEHLKYSLSPGLDIFLQCGAEVLRPTHIITEIFISDIKQHFSAIWDN